MEFFYFYSLFKNLNLRKKIFSFLNSLLLCFVLFLFSSNIKAQVYPVQLSTQLIPPYSGYLPDYADPSSEKFKIILQFNDFLTPQYNVKLKLEIKGNGFTIVTKQLFNPPPIVLQPGIPTIISGVDLAPYLNSSNLDFIGINQAQYENRMALPEGFYSICVTAYDYYNPGKIQVSNQSCSNAWFTLSNPPFLNLPLCSKNITPQVPQNIVFQWTPVNIGSPNSAISTEYDFELWEVRPDSSVNPNQIVLSTAPIYSTTTNLTLINYGIAEPPLNLYMKYVWRVRARDLSGRDWFKNNGYSQICTFVYGNLSSVLGNALNLTLNANGITHRMGHCTWNTQSIYTNYKLQVRKQGTQNWFDYNTSGNFEKVNNLEPNTDYEARVRGEGSALTGDWSNVATFRTLSEPVYGCGDQNFTPDAFQAQPLPISKAVPGLIIQSGQFEVKASQITPNGPQGWYSGKGTAEVYGFPIAVKFNNIYIDDNNRHQQGIIEALTEGITAWTQQWDQNFAEENASYIPGKIDSIWVSGNQICVKIQGDDSCFTMPPNQNIVVVRDGEGNQYNVQTTPPPPKITGPFNYITYGNDNIDAKDSCIVHFEQSSNQQFGFDKKQYAAWLNNYETIKLNNGKTYFVPYKSVGENASDKVKAEIKIIPFDANKLSFKTRGGQVCAHTPAGANSYEVTVPADAGCVYAYYDAKKIGKLNVVTLKQQNRKLVLVPVNNAALSVSNVQNELNKLFGQANVNWSVTTKSSFNFNLGNDGLEAADANLLSKYSTEMRAVRDAYKSYDSLYDKEAYYIFVVNNFNDPGIKGYMVRGRGLGFVAANASVKHLAHELAHGAFGLEHSFPAIAKNTSNNLMDYKEQGVELSAMQWEEMHSSQMVFNWFDTEEDGSLNSNSENCNPSLVPENLRQLSNQAVVCDNGFDTKINAYNTQQFLLAALCPDQRINIIKCLVQGITDDEDETSIIEILRSTPEKQAKLVLTKLKNYDILKNVINSTDGDEFYKLIEVLTSLTIRSYPKPEINESTLTNLISNKKTVYFDDWQALSQSVNNNGTINLKTRKNFHLSFNQEILNVDPFSYILIRYDDDFSINNRYYPVGYYDYVPAIFIYGLFNESNNRKIRLFVDGVLFITGVGEINAAIRTGKGLTLALLDAGVAVSDIALTNVFVDKLNSSESGKSLLHTWNTFAMCYGGVRAGPLVLKGAKNLYIEAKRFLSSNNSLTSSEIQQLNKIADEAKATVNEIDPNEGSKLDAIVNSNTNWLINKLNSTQFLNLKNKFEQLDQTTKTKFINDFGNTNDNILLDLNNDIELVDVWKKWESNGIKNIELIKAYKKVWQKTVRGVSFDVFFNKTIFQINNANNKMFAAELYEAWEIKNVTKLEQTYTKYGLNPSTEYPPCEGIWGISEVKTPSQSDLFDRFQTQSNIGGSYASPIELNELTYTIDSRALKENYQQIVNNSEDYYYFKFKIKNPSPDIKFEYGEAIPWFGKQGGAIQIKSNKPFHLILNEIEIIERWKLINGNWSKI